MDYDPERDGIEPMTEPPRKSPQGDRTMAMLAHLLAIFTYFIGPLVIYLIKKDEDKFVAFHALQAIYAEIFGILTCGIGLIVVRVFNVIGCIKANDGEWYKYPIAGNMAIKDFNA